QELDSNMALIAFLMCFGGFIQDEHNLPALYTKNTVQAVQFMANLFKNGEDSPIFGWNPASNNNYLYSGQASMILNAISASSGELRELDSSMALSAFLMCCGGFSQDEHNLPALYTKSTVQAVQFMANLFKNGEDSAIFGWNPASNNNYLYSGTASMILNAISATRTPEAQNLPFSKDLWIWPIPNGPHGRLGLEHVMSCYSIWNFAQNKDNAMQFLADLCIA